MAKSLMSTAFSSTGDGPYLELDENPHAVHITPESAHQNREEPDGGVVMVNTEITIERSEIV
jgi:hypothetical protein